MGIFGEKTHSFNMGKSRANKGEVLLYVLLDGKQLFGQKIFQQNKVLATLLQIRYEKVSNLDNNWQLKSDMNLSF